MSMRINGVLVGLVFGFLCLFAPPSTFLSRGLLQSGSAWSVRMVGGLLIAFGLSQLLTANDRVIESPTLVTTSVTNGLIALVLLFSYVSGDFAQVGLTGRIVLVLIVAITLTGAVLPLRYLRAEYRA